MTATLFDIQQQSGDTLVYNFTGLPTAATGGGTLTLFTTGTDNSNGLDFGTTPTEYMDVLAVGNLLARYECGAVSSGGILIPGATGLPSACLFNFSIPISAGLLASVISDGTATFVINLGCGVAFFPGTSKDIGVTLTFKEAATVVPLPAPALLLIGGFGALAMLRRRKSA
ncbi:MAG: VPLPA-CTERM sorting domain-containing protein [Pseudomonadota bacterium]